ncbi:MAG: PLP-dependent aspartate aminotransferase family protein, partial [Acidimicrobiales bacterium]
MPQPPESTGDADEHRIETRAITAGRGANEGSLSVPLWSTTAFSHDSLEEAHAKATTPRVKDFYSRYGNPTVAAFEEAVADLEGAQGAQAFASGMGAITATVLALCSTGDHVVAARSLYTSSSGLFSGACPRFGIDVTFVDQADTDAVAAAVIPGRTRLLYVESPANPVLQLADLEALSAVPGPLKVVDSTFAGPFIQRPLELGFDLVIHSATKSLAGHNDATLGVVAGEEDLLQWIWGFHTISGAVASPFDALLALRGIRTLALRVRHASDTAQRLAELLEDHPGVARVHHPGLESHPQRELAKRQMASGGSNLSFEVVGGLEAAGRFVGAVRLCHMAPSLGGPETLVTHPASSTAVSM